MYAEQEHEDLGERRLNVKFSPAAYAQLQAMAARRGKSISQTVREALGFDLWIEEQLAAGKTLLLEDRGQLRQVLVPRRGAL
jgi:hypothetical protein